MAGGQARGQLRASSVFCLLLPLPVSVDERLQPLRSLPLPLLFQVALLCFLLSRIQTMGLTCDIAVATLDGIDASTTSFTFDCPNVSIPFPFKSSFCVLQLTFSARVLDRTSIGNSCQPLARASLSRRGVIRSSCISRCSSFLRSLGKYQKGTDAPSLVLHVLTRCSFS